MKKNFSLKPASAAKMLIVATITLVMIVASLGFGFGGQHVKFAAIANPVAGQPINVSMNVSFANAQWSSEPPQWQFTGSSLPSNGLVNNATAWSYNNSGYQMLVQNATASPGYSYFEYPVGTSLGTNVSYLMFNTRIAVNGTGTYYVVLASAKQTAAPSTTGSTQANSATSAQNYLALKISTVSGKSYYSVSVLYYQTIKGGNGLTYQNYTSTSLSNFYMAPLVMYDFGVYINLNTLGIKQQDASRVVAYAPINDTQIATTGAIFPALENNTANLTYVEYSMQPSANQQADLVANFGYLIDHNTYTANSIAAATPAIAGTITNFASSANTSLTALQNTSYGQAANKTFSPIQQVNTSLDKFSSVLNATTAAMQTSALMNNSYVISNVTAGQVINVTSAIQTLRTHPESKNGFTGTLYVYNFTSAGISAAITTFLKNYIAANNNVPSAYVTVISYTVQNIFINQQFTQKEANTIANYLYNNYAADLKANNLSLVNLNTGAITAGALVGDFYYQGQGWVPEVTAGMIINPATGAKYSTLSAAGFPDGSYIAGGTVIVPQISILGYHNGLPVFSSGAFLSSSGTSGSTSAVKSFFTSGGSVIKNTDQYAATAAAQQVNQAVKALSTASNTSYKDLSNQMQAASQTIMPLLGGTISNIATSIGGTALGQTLKNINNGLASAQSAAAGALAAGKTDVINDIYHLGAVANKTSNTVLNGINTAGANILVKSNEDLNTFWNSANTSVAAADGVIAPIFAAARNAPNTFMNLTDSGVNLAAMLGNKTLSYGQSALDFMGNAITQAANGSYTLQSNLLGAIGNAFVNAGGSVTSAGKSAFNWLFSSGNTVGYTGIIIGAAVVIGAVLIGTILVIRRRRSSGHSEAPEKHRAASTDDVSVNNRIIRMFAAMKKTIKGVKSPTNFLRSQDHASLNFDKMSMGSMLAIFFIFSALVVIEVIGDILFLPADEILVPGEIIFDAVIFTGMIVAVLKGTSNDGAMERLS